MGILRGGGGEEKGFCRMPSAVSCPLAVRSAVVVDGDGVGSPLRHSDFFPRMAIFCGMVLVFTVVVYS